MATTTLLACALCLRQIFKLSPCQSAKQDVNLINKNVLLEEEYCKSKEINTLRFELQQSNAKLKAVQEERAKDSKTLKLYQKCMHELELCLHHPIAALQSCAAHAHMRENSAAASGTDELTEAKLLGEEQQDREVMDEDKDEGAVQELEEKLDSALVGMTMTDLKLQVRKLQCELEAVCARTRQTRTTRRIIPMAQRVTLCKHNPYNTTSSHRWVVKTPGGKLVYYHIKKLTTAPKCDDYRSQFAPSRSLVYVLLGTAVATGCPPTVLSSTPSAPPSEEPALPLRALPNSQGHDAPGLAAWHMPC
ncbi:hypothetical protein CERSUDRAFT_76624 [Gelatoporia subvermispora B]|uniref:Uncharacterized protein n=1 Tax=Ceriporiopsis subvermispora (strain B) TaxID=914234 RepID=M2R5E7_CERS8|nr:hypothetical protein CERSUDRAFT_76624 [Gelatoporia subvermispora B]